ncbi:hypothetical protein [Mycobacterium sp. 852014-50255_SCH5639931]|uniref:hypothetical protein n=1 Tax=Mycobacterium sp. 852014-50255_SCH5639931 TaxID=1834112 RepID=UPI0007FF6CA7|nr:hypothetical protein [Mycobacterium sp. 852014-50255_SCH5639931]OBB62896.1 hypothetical protein A5758_24840 [Mycobacterium sp. 852014-50255_SCH5639931]
MAQYGFKVFKAERMNGTGYTPVPFVDPNWGDFVDHLDRSYQGQRGRKWHENPRDAFDKDGKPIPLDPNSRIVRLDWVERSGMSVFFGLSSGKNDGFRDAMSAEEGAPDQSIQHLAPRRQYRGVFTLPPNETEGVLALEVISRSCPVVTLRQWSSRWSEELVKADAKQNKTSKHCRMKFEQLTDSGQVTSLLSGGEPQEIVLIEHQSPGNGLPDVVQYRLTAPVRQKTTVMQTVKNWVVGGDGGKVSKADGIAQARALVGPEVAHVDFDDCYVSVKHEGQTQHVRPDAYSELFTYDNRTEQRETDEYFRKVNEKLASLGLARTMSLDLTNWPTGLPKLLAATA